MSKRKNTYLLLVLAAIVLISALSLGIAGAAAHYRSNVSKDVLIEPAPQDGGVESKFFKKGGQTVLIGQLDEPKEITIDICGEAGTTISIENSDEELVEVDLSEKSFKLNGEEQKLVLTITDLRTTASDAQTETVTLSFEADGEEYSAAFQMDLPVITGEIGGDSMVEEEENEGGETGNEGTPDEGEDDGTDTDGDGTPEGGTDSDEDNGVTAEGPTMEEEGEFKLERPTSAETGGENTLARVAANNAATETDPTVSITSLSKYYDGYLIPVAISAEGAGTLSYGAAADGLFPQYTRYSTDGGKSWFMFYEPGTIRVTTEKNVVLIDSSDAEWEEKATLVYTPDDASSGASVTVTKGSSFSVVGMQNLNDGEFEFKFPVAWNGCEMDCALYRLTPRSEGAAVYELIYESDKDAPAYTVYNDKSEITVAMGGKPVKAGTYQLIVTHKFINVDKQYVFGKTEIPFFVIYGS